jgi:hypothetical protein
MNLANFFLNLLLLGHVGSSDMIHERVTPFTLSRLAYTVAPVVPRRFSHARVVSATYVVVVPWVCTKKPTDNSLSFFLLSSLLVQRLHWRFLSFLLHTKPMMP